MSQRQHEQWKKTILERLDLMLKNASFSDQWKWEVRTNEEQQEEIHLSSLSNGNSDGLCLSLTPVFRQLEQSGKERTHDVIIDDVIHRMEETIRALEQDKDLRERKQSIFPVLRSPSFPAEKRDGTRLIHRSHTAETTIYYALDLGKSYALIDEKMMRESNMKEEEIHQIALENINKLDVIPKRDDVAGNVFYFFSPKDGYAASRVLNQTLLRNMNKKMSGEMGVAIPHQDVLILADIRNETGYQILGKLTIDFCMKGDIPLSPLPFLYHEDGGLEPIMVINNPGKSPRIRRK